MEDFEKLLSLIVNQLSENGNVQNTAPEKPVSKEVNNIVCGEKKHIPVGISNRHVHLSQEDLDALFGKDYRLTKIKDLSQKGQYACKETIKLIGKKGIVENVRILGPVRKKTQIEILMADTYKLGVEAKIRLSGDLDNTPGIVLFGPRGCVQVDSGVIVAQRHIHMTPQDAIDYNVKDGQIVSVKTEGVRSATLDNVIIRVTDDAGLECHIDTEEGNALGLNPKSTIEIVK